jgi:transketolase
MKNEALKDRIIQISYKYNLSHLGSCLTAVDIIDHIYNIKFQDEKFVLSCGYAALALYSVIEKYENLNAEDIFLHHGIHPGRCKNCNLFCSTGSLGQGFPIALGMAMADKSKNVYCLISDGECAEGSIWESLNIMEQFKVDNLKIFINANGFGAYRKINRDLLEKNIENHIPSIKKSINFVRTDLMEYSFLSNDTSAHYKVLTKQEYDAWNLHL